MASFQIARSPFLGFSRKSSLSCSSRFSFSKKRIFQLQKLRRYSKPLDARNSRICCRLQDDEKEPSNGEEPPESLFMKELRKRGITPTSLLEDSNRSRYGLGEKEMELKEDSGGLSKRNIVSTDYEKSLDNQRERSMALNSEGLEGLIPRAKLLLTIGGTFFLGFWPLILITIAFFSALYLALAWRGRMVKTHQSDILAAHTKYFGPSFVHDASKTPIGPPPYIDPYTLLEDERLSQTAPNVK